MKTLLASLGIVLLMIAPPSAAVHGEGYEAYGVALLCTAPVPDPLVPSVPNNPYLSGLAGLNGGCGDATDEVLNVQVAWGGYGGFAGAAACNYRVIMTDVAGNVVVDHMFPGVWNANGPVFYFFEILAYHGWAETGGWGCFGTAGSSSLFDIVGVQGQQVSGGAPQKAIMYYTGHYLDYTLMLVVPYGIQL